MNRKKNEKGGIFMPTWVWVWIAIWIIVGFLGVYFDKENQPKKENHPSNWWLGWIVLTIAGPLGLLLIVLYKCFEGKDAQ